MKDLFVLGFYGSVKKVISRLLFSCVRDTSSQVGCVSRRIDEITNLNSVTSFLYS